MNIYITENETIIYTVVFLLFGRAFVLQWLVVAGDDDDVRSVGRPATLSSLSVLGLPVCCFCVLLPDAAAAASLRCQLAEAYRADDVCIVVPTSPLHLTETEMFDLILLFSAR